MNVTHRNISIHTAMGVPGFPLDPGSLRGCTGSWGGGAYFGEVQWQYSDWWGVPHCPPTCRGYWGACQGSGGLHGVLRGLPISGGTVAMQLSGSRSIPCCPLACRGSGQDCCWGCALHCGRGCPLLGGCSGCMVIGGRWGSLLPLPVQGISQEPGRLNGVLGGQPYFWGRW